MTHVVPGAESVEAAVITLRRELSELIDDASSIGLDDSLLDSGLDSVRLMTLVERLQQRGADVSFGDLAERPSLREWAGLLASLG